MEKEEIKTTEQAEDSVEEKETKKESKKDSKKESSELEKKDKEIASLKAQLDEQNDKYLRLFAEYENYRKRTDKEKAARYNDAYVDALNLILPFVDNVDRAVMFATDDSDLAKGVLLLKKQLDDVLAKAGVEEIKAEGEHFDPELHNAVMHEEDEELGENVIKAVLQKGYKRGDKVLRYSMVIVAN